MQDNNFLRFYLYFLLLAGIVFSAGSLLVGCSPQVEDGQTAPGSTQNTPGVQTSEAITPYATQTPAISPTATQSALPTFTTPPLPTPTPYMYTVVANDTMIGIASYFGITLDELMVANPEASPNALSIGTQLVIPLDFEDTEGDPSAAVPDVLALDTAPVICYPVRSGGAWCYWSVSNPYDQPVENIAGIINLYDDQNELVGSQAAMSLVNVLESGESIPLIAYFPPPLAQWAEAQGQITGAIYANQFETRYLSASVEGLAVTPAGASSGESQGMAVTGTLRYTQQDPENPLVPAYAWVVAVAYDADGAVTGIRRWETAEAPPAEGLNFSFEVYSLGKPIDQVELLTEVAASAP